MAFISGLTAPAFIHIDMDDLWAVGECYGVSVPAELRHHITKSAIPRFRELFGRLGIRATLFVVGRDLESPGYVAALRSLVADGHAVANHSYSHRLDFRAIDAATMCDEISRCDSLIQAQLDFRAQGFRAPGYAWSPALLAVLNDLGYTYDASLMPSPFGGVFRWMDSRLQKGSAGGDAPGKTQYPLLRDALNFLSPRHVDGKLPPLVQLTSATAPLLRLPFQAGVCMRLGWPYFRANFEAYRLHPAQPFIFLFHAADLADFNSVPIPFFRESPFFASPIERRMALAERFLKRICQSRQVITTEEWLA